MAVSTLTLPLVITSGSPDDHSSTTAIPNIAIPVSLLGSTLSGTSPISKSSSSTSTSAIATGISAPVSTTTTGPVYLTTVFTPASGCYPGLWTSWVEDGGTLSCTMDFDMACFPLGYPPPEDGRSVYYPGVCPSGYNIASTGVLTTTETATAVSGLDTSGFESIALPTSTALSICCLAQMSYDPILSSCSTNITTPTLVQISGTLTSFTSPVALYLDAVFVAWQSKDLSLFTPASAPLMRSVYTSAAYGLTAINILAHSTTSSRTLGDSGSVSVTPPGVTETSRGQNLSTGAQAGVGIGVSIAGAGAVLIGFGVFWRRRKRSSNSMENKLQKITAEETRHVELGLDGVRHEMDGAPKPQEVEANQRHELLEE